MNNTCLIDGYCEISENGIAIRAYNEKNYEGRMPMDNSYVETAKTLENHEQRMISVEHRVKALETMQKSINELAMSVNKLAFNMERMLSEQRDQGDRIKNLEKEPADTWKTFKKTILTSIVSAVAGAAVTGFFLMIAQNL